MDAVLELSIGVTLNEVTSTEGLDALHEEWAQLWARCPAATPFQSPDWIVPLWRHLGAGELWVLCLRHGSRLVGLAPLCIHTQPEDGLRRVLLIGTGITDVLDILLESDFNELGTATVIAHLASNRVRWDILDFQQLRAGSSLLEAETLPGWTSQVTVQEICPVLRLPEDLQHLAGVVPASMLDKLHYYRRRLQKNGPNRIEAARIDTFQELFEQFLKLHRGRWNSLGQNGALADERLQAFHRESGERMLLCGMLRFYGIRVGEQIAGTLYGFSHRGHAYYYLSGFDPALASFSLGTLMIGHAIEGAIAEGCTEFDFLRGREAYKYMWGAKGRLNYRRLFFPARLCEE